MRGHVLVGLRGATTVAADDPQRIHDATRMLLHELMERNALAAARIVSAIFTLTPDLRSAFPARAARGMGWDDIPMICAVEVPVPGAPARCIRVLLHAWLREEAARVDDSTIDGEAGRARPRPRHVYLEDARTLRPELGDE